jgi:redox-sensitive bicupin YhaK (pirin superfamily)
MIEIRRSAERGFADHGWLQSRHSFSFAAYHDPRHQQFGPLRVINEDWIAPGTGFGMHGHRDMEILTYVLEGGISHRDSMGNGSVIRPGCVQRMSAGTGVMHSEHNREAVQTHMLQIWILPARPGGEPSYEEGALDPDAMRDAFVKVATPEGRGGAVLIAQDATLWAGRFDAGAEAGLEFESGRRIYAHLARGQALLNGVALEAGDALKMTGERRLSLVDARAAELLVFDLP